MFKKGFSGNPNGRPIGAKDKNKTMLLEKIKDILTNNIDTIQEDLQCVEPKERLRFLIQLMNYVIPKQQSIAPTGLDEVEPIRKIVIEYVGPRKIS